MIEQRLGGRYSVEPSGVLARSQRAEARPLAGPKGRLMRATCPPQRGARRGMGPGNDAPPSLRPGKFASSRESGRRVDSELYSSIPRTSRTQRAMPWLTSATHGPSM
jgi:hypothetical protein